MLKNLFLMTFLGILLVFFPAFAGDEVVTNEDGLYIAEDIDVGVQATGCELILPANVSKDAVLSVSVLSSGGNFLCPIKKAKFIVTLPTSALYKEKARFVRKFKCTGSVILMGAAFYIPNWIQITPGGTVEVKARVRDGVGKYKCSGTTTIAP